MEAKEIMSKFDELYGIMASSTNVKYMRTFGDTMRCMMKDMASKHPELAQEYLDKLCAIKWKNYLTKKEASDIIGKMKIALEDELIDNVKRKYGVDFSFNDMDVIIDGCVDVAKIWIK